MVKLLLIQKLIVVKLTAFTHDHGSVIGVIVLILLFLALLKYLVVHRHVRIDLVQKVWVKFELQLIFFFLLLLAVVCLRQLVY